MYRKALIISVFLCFLLCILCIEGQVCVSAFAMGEKPVTTAGSPKAIDFTLKDLEGKTHKLSDYKGKIVFLNFWATWCPPCRAEMPSMQKIYETWDSKKFVMLAVAVKQNRDVVKNFIEENAYNFPVLLDSDGKVAGMYRVRGIPTTYLIDKEGNIITRVVGSREWTLEEIYGLVE